jgi:hypothetical protein
VKSSTGLENLLYLENRKKRGAGNAVHWQAPEGDTIKINTDGAFDSDTRTGGWGFIARDATGSVRGAGAGRVNHAGSAMQTEAIVCAEALQAAADWGMSKIIIETDALKLVSALKSSEYDLSPEGVIFRDSRVFISLNFGNVEVSFAPRMCNNVAHSLAAYGVSHMAERERVDEVPHDVHDVMVSEFAVHI